MIAIHLDIFEHNVFNLAMGNRRLKPLEFTFQGHEERLNVNADLDFPLLATLFRPDDLSISSALRLKSSGDVLLRVPIGAASQILLEAWFGVHRKG